MIKILFLIVMIFTFVLTSVGWGTTTSTPTTEADFEAFADFEAELEDLRQKLKIPAFSAAIVQDQELVWAKGFGYADLENKIEAIPDTPYHLASLTKPFAATIIMQLIEAGLLDLNDPVSKYGIDIKSQGIVKVKHLLTMTSEGNPGENYKYNGDRFALLDKVIQKASGKSFLELLSERIFEPLQMTNTAPNQGGGKGFLVPFGLDAQSRNYTRVRRQMAKPYKLDSSCNTVKGYYHSNFSPAAGLISTVVDMAKFDIAIDQNVLVSQDTKTKMFAPTISTTGAKLPYGLGWFTQNYNNTRLIWHYGNWPPSVSSLVLKVPDENITFIILANNDNLSRPFNLGNGDVLNSAVALEFYKTFMFPLQQGGVVPDIDWEADESKLANQLIQYTDDNLQQILERELFSYRMLFASVARRELVNRLGKIQGQVRFERLLRARGIASDVNSNIHEDYTGRYTIPAEVKLPIASVTVTKDDDRFYIDIPDGPEFDLFLLSETRFFHIDSYGSHYFEVTFIKDDTGMAIRFIIEKDGHKFTFERIDTQTAHQNVLSANTEATSEKQRVQNVRSPLWSWLKVESPWLQNEVLLDGTITSKEEWSDAVTVDLTLAEKTVGPATISSRWWIKNDKYWLYILARLPVSKLKISGAYIAYSWPYPSLEHSDLGWLDQNNFAWDAYRLDIENWLGDIAAIPPGENNIEGVVSKDDTYIWFEFRKALDSGDGHDWNWAPGETVGTDLTGNLSFGIVDEATSYYFDHDMLLHLASPPSVPVGKKADYQKYSDWPVIATIDGVGNNADEIVEFTLDECKNLRIYAIGEGTQRNMKDFGSIENAVTGQTIWQMHYFETNPAGWAKNRRVDRFISLPAGTYNLHFKTDNTYSFEDWGALLPDHHFWGITLYEEREQDKSHFLCWERVTRPEELGWSSKKLNQVIPDLEKLNCAALMIVTDGKVVFEWGNTTNNFKAHSVRKSLISALYGIYVADGKIDTSKTLKKLGIDDQTPLTEEEKKATVANLLKARSGIYIPAAGEVKSMRDERPKRGSHEHNTFWYYNNWDFNALGTIFDQETKENIYEAFKTRIADPIGMQDFTTENLHYRYEYQFSMHPYYGFRISARDLARFGQLYLQEGEWQGVRLIPAEWVKESTKAYSLTGKSGTYSGYGYMWWIAAKDYRGIKQGSYAASGLGGHTLEVLPYLNTVIVLRVNTDNPEVNLLNFSNVDQLIVKILGASRYANDPFIILGNVWLFWFILIVGSLAILIRDLARNALVPWWMRLIWLLIIILFGPIGLLVYLISYRLPQRSLKPQAVMANWKSALGESVYNVTGFTMGILVMIAYFIYIQPNAHLLTTLVVSYIVPFLIDLMFFRTLFVVSHLGGVYWIAVQRTIFAQVISTNLVWSAGFPLILLLRIRWFPGFPQMVNPRFWLMILLAAIAGLLIVYPFNLWMARRGFNYWTTRIFAGGKTAIKEESIAPLYLKNVWGVLLLSFVLLIISVVIIFTYLF